MCFCGVQAKKPVIRITKLNILGLYELTRKVYMKHCINLSYKARKRELLYVVTFDKDRFVRDCRYTIMYNSYLGYMIWSLFWKF